MLFIEAANDSVNVVLVHLMVTSVVVGRGPVVHATFRCPSSFAVRPVLNLCFIDFAAAALARAAACRRR